MVDLLGDSSVFVAMAEYNRLMKANPVINSTLIIRRQVEYSTVTQTVSLRCMLETPATNQRRGFTDIAALLAALQAELTGLQNQIIPLNKEKE